MQELLKSKFFIVLLTLFSINFFSEQPISGHGFLPNMYLINADGRIAYIEEVCGDIADIFERNPHVMSYDFKTKSVVKQKAKKSAQSEISSYVIIYIKNMPDIYCSPAQKFYKPNTKTWVHAKCLKIGDELLTIDNKTEKVTNIELINQRTEVYTITVNKTNNFYVGKHKILTHNMAIPPLHLGFSYAFGQGAISGGTAGSFLGPKGMAIFGGIGGVGSLVYYLCSGEIPTLDFNIVGLLRSCFNRDSYQDPDKGKPTTCFTPDSMPEIPTTCVTPMEPISTGAICVLPIVQPEKPLICAYPAEAPKGPLVLYKNNENHTPINQIKQLIDKGKAPKTIQRIDKAKQGSAEQDHIHFKDDWSINRDGTLHHSPVENQTRRISNSEKEFLKKAGFKAVSELKS